MEIWQVWLFMGLILLILEMFTPALFFASIAIGCISAGILSYSGLNIFYQISVFTISAISIIFLIRPLLLKKIKNGKYQTGVNKYIDKHAKVIQKISNIHDIGRVRIFDEEWTARSNNNQEFDEGTIVQIKKIEDMILYVDKTGE